MQSVESNIIGTSSEYRTSSAQLHNTYVIGKMKCKLTVVPVLVSQVSTNTS